VKLRCQLLNALLPLVVVHLYSAGALFVGVNRTSVSGIALKPLDFAVRSTSLRHLRHTCVRSQLSFGASLQLAVESLIVSVQRRD
jgi:hypothetical protein